MSFRRKWFCQDVFFYSLFWNKDCACCWTLSPAESRIQLSLVCPLAPLKLLKHVISLSFSAHLQQFEQSITWAKLQLIARTRSELDWLNPGWMLRASTFVLFRWFCCFLLQLKESICFTFFAHQLFLGQIAWADTLDVSGGKVSHCTVPVCSWCVGAVAVLVGPQCREVAGHLCSTLLFCLAFL